jgi:uncharacterized protein YegP (UPF0339 family)
MANFEIYRDAQGNYHWRFRANNGTLLARSEEGFINQINCERSILLLKQQAPKASMSVEFQIGNQLKGVGES